MISLEYLKTWHDRRARKYLYNVNPYGGIMHFSPGGCSLFAEMKGRGPDNMPEIVGIRKVGHEDVIRLACLYKTEKAAENSLRSGAREEKLKPEPEVPTTDDFMKVIGQIFDEV